MSDLTTLEQRHAQAEQAVRRFVRRFEPSYHALACHVALPLVLTPELVNYLRNEFLRNEDVPWVAEVDLLLSDLCQPVGYELYAMDTDVRAYLLAELERQFGRARIQQVAKLLISYVRYLSETGSSVNEKELEAQQWAAMVYLDENQCQTAVRQIAEKFQAGGAGANSVGDSLVNPTELARLAQITMELAPQLANYPDLLDYAALVSEVMIGNSAVDAAQVGQSYEILPGYELELPGAVAEREIDQATKKTLRGNYSQADSDEIPNQNIPKYSPKGNQGRTTKKRRIKSTSIPVPVLQDLKFETGYFIESSETELFNNDVQSLLKPQNPHARSLLAFIQRTIRGFGLQGYVTEVDIFVEAYLRGVKYTQQHQEEILQPKAWMRRTAYNIIREIARDRQQYSSIAFDESMQEMPAADNSLNSILDEGAELIEQRSAADDSWSLNADKDNLSAALEAVQTALETLSLEDRRLIQWQLIEGLTWQEIQTRILAESESEAELIPLATLRKRGQRVLEKLRRAYHDNINSDPAFLEEEIFKKNIIKTVSPVTSDYRNDLAQYMKLFQRKQGSTSFFVEPFADAFGIQMILLPAGTFLMGSPANEQGQQAREGSQHAISINKLSMARYPITQTQWRFVADLPRVNLDLNLSPSRFTSGTHPVQQVSWFEAVEFCDRLSLHTGRPYRLPTEAEWEYACRAGTTTPFHFGETITTDLANYNGADAQHGAYGRGPKGENRQTTTPVDHFGIANAFGLCDMHGNVWEWCQDPWRSTYGDVPSKRKTKAAPQPDQSTHRVARGGSWYTTPQRCRSASRIHFEAESRHPDLGFRVVLSFYPATP
jgi:formylglycine-generating enzyme required for sulfatase activity